MGHYHYHWICYRYQAPSVRSPTLSPQEISLLICDRKRELYNPSKSVTTFGAIPVVSRGTEILEVSTCYVQSACYETAQQGSALCSELVTLDCPQSALLLLRHCHVPRLNHLARCVPPNLFEGAAQFHDNLTQPFPTYWDYIL